MSAHHYPFKVRKNGNDTISECRQCNETNLCFFWLFGRHGSNGAMFNVTVQGGNGSLALLCSSRCAKRYTLPQYSLMRLKGQI